MLENLDSYIKPYFLKDVVFTLKNKPYKKGKLLNYKLSGCYLSFIVITTKKKETFEIPFPYAIKNTESGIVLDYTFESLAEQDFELLVNLKSVTQVKKSKFYNTLLTISVLK
jgi:hypothetical protein